MTTFQVVVADEAIEVTLDFGGVDVPGGAATDADALIEQGPVHAFDDAVGSWAAHAGGAILDAFHGESSS